MKFTRKDRGLMRSLKARGTAVGPVTQEMIDLAVAKYEGACSFLRQEPQEFGWADFIGPAREQLVNGE
jgi:hypothetical protein